MAKAHRELGFLAPEPLASNWLSDFTATNITMIHQRMTQAYCWSRTGKTRPFPNHLPYRKITLPSPLLWDCTQTSKLITTYPGLKRIEERDITTSF